MEGGDCHVGGPTVGVSVTRRATKRQSDGGLWPVILGSSCCIFRLR